MVLNDVLVKQDFSLLHHEKKNKEHTITKTANNSTANTVLTLKDDQKEKIDEKNGLSMEKVKIITTNYRNKLN